jgi:dTDP-L-rhamnose 4-epimerase
MGDIRHCFPDISRARSVLGYQPQISLEEGIGELVEWLDGRVAVDRIGEALTALASRGLTV